MQGHRSNSFLGVDAPKEPPYDITTLFTSENPTWMMRLTTVLAMFKKANKYDDKVRIKMAGIFNHSYNIACFIRLLTGKDKDKNR